MSKNIVRFNLAFDTVNAAFDGDYFYGEVERIFEHVIQRLNGQEGPCLYNETNLVRDVNGNVVGSFILTTEDQDG